MGVNGIYGLSGSGLDIESMVKASMLTKQTQYDKMYKKETKQEWTKAAYNDFYSSMMTYRFSTLSTYKLESNMNAMGATTSDSKVVTVSANAEAAAMSHKVTVTDMVQNPYLQTYDKIKRGGSDQTSVNLKDIIGLNMTYTADASDSTKDKVTVGGESYDASAIAMSLVVSGGDDTTYKTTYPSGWTDNGDGTSTAVATTTDGTTTYTTTYTKKNASNQISATTADAAGNSYATNFSASTTDPTDFSKGTTNVTIHGKSFDLSTAGTKVPVSGKTLVYTYKQLNEKTLYDLAADIKGLETGVNASYDAVNDSFSLFNSNGGSASNINISAFTGTYTDSEGNEIQGAAAGSEANFYTLFNNLRLAPYDGTELKEADIVKLGTGTGEAAKIHQTGQDGTIVIDGKSYKNLTSNKVTVAGVTYNLLAAGTSTVTVSQDTDAIVKNVKQFVEDYNKLLDSMNTKINEKATSGYEPLTKTEKSAMKDTEITAWETKAKSGLLYHDSILRDITSKMREALSTPVSSVTSSYNSAAALGITSSTDQGHITLDETKLRKALTADPSCVYKVFASSTDDTEDTANTGIANRLDSVMKTAISKIASQAGTTSDTSDQSYLGLQITEMQTQMKAFSTAMDDYRTALYKKFDAMETALANLNSQYSFVTSSFS